MTGTTFRTGRVGVPAAEVAAASGLLSLGAAAIHLWVVPEHLQEYWPFGVFFVAVAIGQLLWAGAVVRWPSRVSFGLGALGSALLIGLWLMSRTVGTPIGPEPWEPESLAALDLTCVVLEAGIVGLAAVAVRSRLHETNRHHDSAAPLKAASVERTAKTVTTSDAVKR